MSTVDLQVSGAAVFWNLSAETDRSTLERELDALGLKEFLPEERTAPAALKSALSRVVGGSGVLIRPLADSEVNGFVAVKEVKGDTVNSYETICTARLGTDDQGKQVVVVQGEAVSEGQKLRLQGEFAYQKSVLTQAQVAKALVGIIETPAVDGGLEGTALRPSGGFYWVPEKFLDRWQQVVGAFERSAVKVSVLYTLRVIYDNQSVSAVKDAIINEVRSRAKEIEEYAAKDGLGERAYRNRAEAADKLHARVASYEAMLRESLDELHALADTTKDTVMDLAAKSLPDIFGGDKAVSNDTQAA